MRKTPVVLAVAAIFDLGLMVAGAHAEKGGTIIIHDTTSVGPVHVPQATSTAGGSSSNAAGHANGYLKVQFTDLLVSSLKVSGVSPEMACMNKGGTVITKGGQEYCHLPVAKGSSPEGR